MPHEKRTGKGAASGLLGFIGLSVAAGVLVTAAVTPALAVTGMTANGAIGVFDDLPHFLTIDPPMERTSIIATHADGTEQELATFFDQNRIQVGWDSISPFFKDAAVSAEDPRFFEHGGVDILGTTRAVIKTYAVGGSTQGGSSITQQYVKNVLVQKAEQIPNEEESKQAYEDAIKTSPERKLREMRYSIGLEKEYSKDQILQGYLNIANFGGRAYGVEAASQYYFGVSAADVTIEQAAALVATLNNPSNLRFDQPESEYNGEANGYAKTKERRDYVILKMLEEGKITQEQHDTARATEIVPNIHQPSTGCSTAGGSAYFCSYVQRTILNDEAFGAEPEDRAATLRRGGLKIYTTLDMDVQSAAENSMNEYVPKDVTSYNLGAAGVTVQPKTGRILAMVQNRDFTEDPALAASSPAYSAINYNADYAYGGSNGFQVGSTYKVFVLVDWLKQGHSINEPVDASKRAISKWRDSCVEGGVWTTKPWSPKNYDGNATGKITPYEATRRSVNTAFVSMASKLDMCEIRQTALDMGVHRADGGELSKQPSAVLGANEISPLSMATAIASIGAGGTSCSPVAIDKIIGPDGNEVPAPKSNCSQAITPEVAATAAYAMSSVFGPGGTGANARVPGAPLYGKTGTSDFAYDTWITGGTTNAVTSFWIGNVQARESDNRKISMYDMRVNRGTSAFQAKFRVFAGITASTIAKYGGDAFPKPSSSLTKTRQVAVPDVVGKTVAEAKSAIESAGFSTQIGDPVTSAIEAGRVAGTDPAAGTSVTAGNTITIRPSDGLGKSVPNVVGQAPDRATEALEKLGFKVDLRCVADPSTAEGPGTVTAQTPEADIVMNTKDANASLTVTKQSC